jgi:hypothetical protein
VPRTVAEPAPALMARPAAAPVAAAPVARVEPPARPLAVVAAAPVVEQPKPIEAPSPRLVVADVQPLFVALLQSMQAGGADAVTRGLDRNLRGSEGVEQLTRVYRHLIGQSTSIKVGQVQMRGKPDGDQLVVDGVIQLLLQDQGSPAPVRELRVRAVFARQAGQVAMTQLSAGS